MDAEPQRNRPTPGNATSAQAEKGRVLLGLKYNQTRGAPTRHPRFHPDPGSPQLAGLTSRIEGKPPQVARVSSVPVTSPYPERHQIKNVNPRRHLISWQLGHPQRSAGISCPQGTRHAGQHPGVRHHDTIQPDTC